LTRQNRKTEELPTVIALVGQMGAGKSTVGRLLARQLSAGLPGRRVSFVDLDAAIEARIGRPIADFFASDGEAAFRAIEFEVLQTSLTPSDSGATLVLATGGGAPCSDAAIDALLSAGEVVWLDTPPAVLATRALTADRPLLAGRTLAEAEAFLRAQRAARLAYYDRARVHLDGTLEPQALAAAVAARYLDPTMSNESHVMPAALAVSLPPEASAAPYPIVFVAELPGVAAAAEVDRLLPSVRRLLVVTDSNVGPLYAADVVAALSALPRIAAVALFTVPAGEASKQLSVLQGVCDAALDAGLTRYDALVALGGGVVGDLTGFAASILHRGVPVLQIPTTLLAQVDSSVGGKTAVNHAKGKNLLGSFWQPVAVISSQRVLATLSPREFRCGLAEAIKHAAIADASFMTWIDDNVGAIEARDPAALAYLVHRCCSIKRDVVVRDPRDQGERALLNFGHTLGHAYERLVGYGTLTHGEAVALGMLWAALLSEQLAAGRGGCPALYLPLRDLLARFGFAVDLTDPTLPTLSELLPAARSDKKADGGGTVRFVTLSAIGEATITPLPWAEVADLLVVAERRLGRED